MSKCWQTTQFYHDERVFEVEYTHHPGEDWGGFGWRVPPSIEIHEVRVIEGEPWTGDNSILEELIYDERHR